MILPFLWAALHPAPILIHRGRITPRSAARARHRRDLRGLACRGGFRACWVTSNWEPGSRNADGSRFQHGITAAPKSIPYHSIVLIRFKDGHTQRVIAADREKHGRLNGKPHFDLARPGNRSEDAVYKIVHIGDGRYRKAT